MQYLYKYFSLDSMSAESISRTKNVLVHNELYFSNPIDFNDPLDCNLLPPFPTPPQKTNENQSEHAKIDEMAARAEVFKTGFIKGFYKFRDGWSICCFSEKSDNVLMWSHYANGHTGYCLEFDITKAFNSFYNFHSVVYTDKYPKIDILFGKNVLHDTFLTKSLNWQYEKEWRIVRNEPAGLGYYPPITLTKIIFGYKMSKESKSVLCDMLNFAKPGLPIWEAKLKALQYDLDILPSN